MQGFTYAVDLVLVVDATGSMSGIIERVKSSALSFQQDLEATMKEKGKHIDQLRVRLVVYRDFYVDAPQESLRSSPFYTLPDETESFAAFVKTIEADGGGDEPETALEALAEAMRSPWFKGSAKRRQVIVVWTDASTHPLEKDAGRKPDGYPANAPASFDALTDLWEGQECMDQYAKRLVVFAPDAYAWSDIANHWENTAQYVSKAGAGLADQDYRSILDGISESI